MGTRHNVFHISGIFDEDKKISEKLSTDSRAGLTGSSTCFFKKLNLSTIQKDSFKIPKSICKTWNCQ